MRKLLLFVILVIVLVSINWFRGVLAQDLSSLSPSQIEQLKRKYGNAQPATDNGPTYYESPEIFEPDERPDAANTAAGPTRTPKAHDTTATGDRGDRLPEFEDLRPFGMELFDDLQEVSPPADIASADDYVLGPGDNVIVYLWGRVEREYNLTLDRDGTVFIPKVGDVIAWGLNLEQFRDRLRKHLSRAYSDFDLTVSLGKIRSIRIYVTGEVRQPGAYTVSSLTSVLNAIFAAGGPNNRGSMRAIKVMRGGEAAAVIDLYDLLLEGDNSSDIKLRTGDAVFVPVAGTRVSIRGEIKRSAVYELTGGETIGRLFKLAGRPTPQAYLDRVMLERISPQGQWEVRDLNLRCDEGGPCDNIELSDGDRITIYSIYDLRRNMIAIAGQVKHPGYYERNDSTRVADLIKRGQLQPYDVYFERADIFRRYADRRIEVIPVDLARALAGDPDNNLLLSDRDSLHVYNINDVLRNKYVHIEGEVRSPGRFPLYESMTVGDLIFLSGSFNRSADLQQAELARVDSLGGVSIVPLTLADSTGMRMPLQEDDHLYIRRIPDWEQDRSITVAGEVQFPGTYWLKRRDESLYDILTRAGGFTPAAFPKGLVFERQSIREELRRQRISHLIEQSQPITLDSLGHPVADRVFKYQPESMNRIIIDIEQILATDGTEGDVIMQPGDHIFVPTIPSGVSVMGAVGANGTLRYVQDRSVRDYISRAGNFTRQADKNGTRLMRADGEVLADGVLGKKVELGDMIVVPSEIKRDRDWLKTVSSVVAAAAGAVTSVYLISKL